MALIYKNFELTITNVAIKLELKERSKNRAGEEVATLMFRMNELCLFRKEEPFASEEDQRPRPDFESFLDGKNLTINQVSIHLMKHSVLSSQEYIPQGKVNPSLSKLTFPYEYPTLNHPSTILSLKSSSTNDFLIAFRFDHELLSTQT